MCFNLHEICMYFILGLDCITDTMVSNISEDNSLTNLIQILLRSKLMAKS